MIGIYKITNPNNEIYIGQSIDIEKRKLYYERLYCKGQPKLYESISKLGWNNHKFDIIIQCEYDDLNILERFYQEYYDAVNSGLNCRYTETYDKSGKLSSNTISKLKISQSKNRLLKQICPHCHNEYDIANLKRWHLDNCKNKPEQYKKRWSPSEKTRLLMSESHKGISSKNHNPWNKGLTKESDERIKIASIKLSISKTKKIASQEK